MKSTKFYVNPSYSRPLALKDFICLISLSHMSFAPFLGQDANLIVPFKSALT